LIKFVYNCFPQLRIKNKIGIVLYEAGKKNEFECEAIPFGDGLNWIYAEVLHKFLMQLIDLVDGLEQELMLLKINPHLQNPPPKPMTDACCQTRDQSAMEIELVEASSPRRTIRCSSLKKKIFYTKVYTRKHVRREQMEIEKEKITHHPKPKRKILKKSTKTCKNFCTKGDNGIKTKNAQLKNPSKECCKQEKKTQRNSERTGA